ncbi:MAG TPA: AraC family transcriptional regulator ligand-binding domain-containing protein [Kofleriaceae bacterium]|nr:AraC family transcriptional regulator ligand-binding domain-containing protein [Kofleriaceae bacterium]
MQREGEAIRERARAPIVRATCSVRVIRPFARYLAQLGCDDAAWLRPHGLTPADLGERDLRVGNAQVAALLASAAALSGDPAIGVKAVRCAEPGDFDVMEYAAANCATVGEALQLAARFLALMHDGVRMELDVVPPLAALRVRPMWGSDEAPAGIEFLFASLLAYGSRSVGHPTRPMRVELSHAGPPPGADLSAYEEAFREVRFGCDSNVMWLTASALELPHCTPDRSLLQILTTHADGLLRQLAARPTGIAERARAVIAETLHAGHSGAEPVARRLAISLRTLHRRLAEEGTSHGELLDDVRREQALIHLAGNRFSISEIAFLLGFSHPNAFHKAFKRWMAVTPVQYRASVVR